MPTLQRVLQKEQSLFAEPCHPWRLDSGFPSGGWPPIAEGKHTLLIAPTGSGKTLAAFLAGIDAVGRLPDTAEQGVRLLPVDLIAGRAMSWRGGAGPWSLTSWMPQ